MVDTPDQAPVPIGIAVVEHQGKFLIGHLAPGSPLPGQAEFPGGKCHAGESSGVCARRECLEETGLEVITVDLLMRRVLTYPHATLDLHFWLCRPAINAQLADEHQGYRWIPREELASLNFPEGNKPLIEVLTKRSA